jgi:hypothetical protein
VVPFLLSAKINFATESRREKRKKKNEQGLKEKNRKTRKKGQKDKKTKVTKIVLKATKRNYVGWMKASRLISTQTKIGRFSRARKLLDPKTF